MAIKSLHSGWPVAIALLAALHGASATAAASRAPYGICAHVTGGERKELPRTVAATRAAGIGMVRCDFWWSALERPDGAFDFSATDAAVAEAKTAGVAILPILLNVHPNHPAPFEDDVPWRRYVRAVVERYAADCPAFEVWNEPNHSQNGHGCENPTNYVKVLKAASEEIRAAAPGARVVLAGLAGWGPSRAEWLRAVYALGSASFFDVMNIHVYCIPDGPERAYLSELDDVVRPVMTEFGDAGKPIWVTEIGWPTNETDPGWDSDAKDFRSKVGVDEARQSAYLARGLGTAYAAGVEMAMPYELRDRGGDRFDRESRFGLLHETFAPKPAFSAYATFIAMRPAGSVQRPGPFFDGDADFFFPQWRRPDGTPAGMLWLAKSEAARRVLRFTAGVLGVTSAPRFFEHSGREIYPEAVGDGEYSLDLTGSPIYFIGAEFAAP